MLKLKAHIQTIFTILLSTIIALAFCEIVLRVKHHFIPHYDIEMGKYAKTLKVKVQNKKINHVHKKNGSAVLQKILITTNSNGQRNEEIDNKILENYNRKFLIIGSPIALGWGVEQSKTFSSRLNDISKENNKNWIFINGGIGNYNTERYVNNYFNNWKQLDFTDIIVHFFVNDTELIMPNKTNIFTRHTHLGVVTWKLFNSYKASFKKDNITEYYKKKYNDDYLGFQVAKAELTNLKKYCDLKKINCTVVLMPDIHQLKPYNLSFINRKVSTLTKELNMSYFDLLPALQDIEENTLWNKYQDPHPNSYGHKIIAEEIYTHLTR